MAGGTKKEADVVVVVDGGDEGNRGGDAGAAGDDCYHGDPDRIVVRDVKQDVVSRCERLPEGDSVRGGVVCNGFFDVEKLIFIPRHDRHGDDRDRDKKTVLYLEKMLPFQLVIVRIA